MRVSRLALSVALAAAVAAGALSTESRGDGSWTQLPQEQWTDQFSPLYVDEDGNLCEGNPSAPDEPTEAFIVRNEWDAENEEFVPIQSIENEALVNFNADVPPVDITEILDDLDLSIVAAWYEPDVLDPESSMSWFHVRVLPTSTYFCNVPGLVTYLRSLSSVDFAEPNDVRPMMAFPEDPPDDTEYDNQTELPLLNADAAWATETGTPDIGVVVMDSGVDTEHEDLTNKIYRHPVDDYRMGIAALKDKTYFGDVDELSALRSLQTGKAGHGHGTCVAGIVGAETNNNLGVAGCGPDLRVLSARLYMPSANSLETSAIVRSVKKLRKKLTGSTLDNVRVVNMSFGGSASDSIKQAIKKDLKSNDRLYVGAAGNDGKERKHYPAAYSFVLGVTGAKDDSGTDKRHQDSNYWNGGGSGSTPDRDVYGVSGYYHWAKTTDVTGSDGYASGKYAGFGGTSGAAPQISALAGLLYAIDEEASYTDVDAHIRQYTKGSDNTNLSFTVGSKTKKIPAVADFERAVENF